MPPRLNRLVFRILYPVWALIARALFLIAGVVVVDDDGVSWDEHTRRRLAAETFAYIAGDDDAFTQHHEEFYGMTFELPLLLVRRVLGLEDARSLFLSRHILIHLFFIVGGFFCCLLAWKAVSTTSERRISALNSNGNGLQSFALTAWSFEFSPPRVRPMQRESPPFSASWLRYDAL